MVKAAYKPFFASSAIIALLCIALCPSAHADNSCPDASLTIYNQQFAVVRNVIPLKLTAGVNSVNFSGITSQVEPDSVTLRDPLGKTKLRVLEQNYRSDVATQDSMLAKYEGQTIDFQTTNADGTPGSVVQGRVVKSGHVMLPEPPPTTSYSNGYMHIRGSDFNQVGFNYPYGGWSDLSDRGITNQPVIEANGKQQFTVPGRPLFPPLANDSILVPTLDWKIKTNKLGPLNAELAYVTGGLVWKAAYNVVVPESGAKLALTGWVTIENQSGLDFQKAHIKLMAGDVSKIKPRTDTLDFGEIDGIAVQGSGNVVGPPKVTQKSFGDYHLYTLPLPTTLRNRETKQVEFEHAANIDSNQIYIYDGAQLVEPRYENYTAYNFQNDHEYGTDYSPKVAVAREFKNSVANGLGVPLPAGRMRFYGQDADGALEFLGERDIDHTPKDETIRVITGDAIDLVGSRLRTDYFVNTEDDEMNETFAINLRNHKSDAVEIRVVEHLYRASDWKITKSSDPFTKTDSRTIEFRVNVPADGEKTVTYSVHYAWAQV